MSEDAAALTPAELRAWTRPALVRLLRVVTGDDRHLEEPVAWLAARTGLVTVRPEDRRQELALRDPEGRVFAGARTHYGQTAEDLWLAWLDDRGWTVAYDVFDKRRATSPSGRAYYWHGWYLARDADEALVVACSREGYDVAAELAASERLLRWLCGERAEAETLTLRDATHQG